MKLPKMILFDMGQTLINEAPFDGIKGYEALLKHAKTNKYNMTAEQIAKKADEINEEFGRWDPKRRHKFLYEIPDCMFMPYLFESSGIVLDMPIERIDKIFWDASSPGVPTKDVFKFLEYIKSKNIRSAVVSNIAIAPLVVADRINEIIYENDFEFILTSSNYIYRKPHRRIFELALEKADLKPEEVWYIGDSYKCDVVGANATGITPVWFVGASKEKYEKKDDCITVESWNELIGVMQGGAE